MVEKRRCSLQISEKLSNPVIGVRHVQCLLIFCGLCLIYGMRVNLSMAIVAMMDNAGANPNFPVSQKKLQFNFIWNFIYAKS